MGPEKFVVTAEMLQQAWRKYYANFGEAPHGTLAQFRAMLCFLPAQECGCAASQICVHLGEKHV